MQKTPQTDPIEDNDGRLYYWTEEIVEDKLGLEWFVFKCGGTVQTFYSYDDDGEEIETEGETAELRLYVNTEIPDFILDELK